MENIKTKVTGVLNNVKYYWKEPPKGKYMNYKEIASYALGGIGANFILQLAFLLMVSTTNMVVAASIGVSPDDMYILYLIVTLVNIPLTAVRANMIDNVRGKGGKYRPYLISMGIPTAVIAVAYVWFPYERLGDFFTGETFSKSSAYVATCAIVLVFNLLLQFFYNFFYDAYTNLIHVLSPDTQERTNVLAIKSVAYSLAPSILNIARPVVAQLFANNNLYDITVYRIYYPVFSIIGVILTVIVYANTQEKIVQAKTHTIQVSFLESLKEVAKNKYFWIIALAGWLGFLENTYGTILEWSQTYGHTCNGTTLGLINTILGNASLWGMILAPICIKRFGKKRVLIFVNTMNVLLILAMRINMYSIWWLAVCIYFNWLVGAFEQITTPAIQADIRDYQQYKTGERIDGMFSTVNTIGNIVTLFTSAILPAVEKNYGVFEGNGYDKPFDILDMETGEPGLLYKVMGALIFMAALGAFLNMVPYLFYDFTEKKQKSVIRVLKIRSLFEDYGNNALRNSQIVEAIDLVNEAREMAVAEAKAVSKNSYRNIKEKEAKKEAKMAYRDALNFNEEIEIAQFVCRELDKFNTPEYILKVEEYGKIYEAGLDYIKNINISEVKAELREYKKLPKDNEDNKAIREFRIKLCRDKISAKKNYDVHFSSIRAFEQPSMENLTKLFDEEDEITAAIYENNKELTLAKKEGDKPLVDEIKQRLKELKADKSTVQKKQKVLMDEFAMFNRAARPYNDAKKLLTQKENYSHFSEIEALYDEAKEAAEEEDRIREEKMAEKIKEEEEELARRKAEKEAKKKMKNKR